MSTPARRRNPADHPLYDARFEHDACGVGFVADAGGHSRDRVLPLALTGLASLAHRGAFGADGESSDGAGVALPLDRSILELITADAGLTIERSSGAPGVLFCFLPRSRSARSRARALVEQASSGGRSAGPGLARGPVGSGRPRGVRGGLPAGLRPGDRGSTGAVRRRPTTRHRRRLRAPARHRPTPRRDRRTRRRWRGRRAVDPVLVLSDDRLQGSGRRRASAGAVPGPAGGPQRRLRGLPPAVRHQHAPGLAARPAVPLDRPQRRDQHGPRQSRAGPRAHERRRARRRGRRRAAGGRPAALARRLRLPVT